MVTSRNTFAALITAVCLQAAAWAGPIRSTHDLHATGHAIHGGSVHAFHRAGASSPGPIVSDRAHYLRTHEGASSHRGLTASVTHGKTHQSSGQTHTGTTHVLTSAHHERESDGPPIAPVPEPSGVALAVTGVGALTLMARRRKGGNA